jgi:hypothetical protein
MLKRFIRPELCHYQSHGPGGQQGHADDDAGDDQCADALHPQEVELEGRISPEARAEAPWRHRRASGSVSRAFLPAISGLCSYWPGPQRAETRPPYTKDIHAIETIALCEQIQEEIVHVLTTGDGT